MPLPNVLNGTARRCHATAKHSGLQCKQPCAYGMPVCRFHGANKKIRSGVDCNFYVHGNATRAERKARPAKLKKAKEEIKQLEELLKQEVILELPFTDPVAKKLNAEMDKIAKNAVKKVFQKHKAKTASKKSPVIKSR
ncbi:MAG: hypothetical protein WCP01_05990 [Methylococcaceae bacterium]